MQQNTPNIPTPIAGGGSTGTIYLDDSTPGAGGGPLLFFEGSVLTPKTLGPPREGALLEGQHNRPNTPQFPSIYPYPWGGSVDFIHFLQFLCAQFQVEISRSAAQSDPSGDP